MSNNNRPPLTLPRAAVPPPPAPAASNIPAEFTEFIKKYPPPWVVGPYDATDDTYMIFVASDVEPVKDESRMNQHGAVFNGWISRVPKPRMVVALGQLKVMCELFVFAVNKLAR